MATDPERGMQEDGVRLRIGLRGRPNGQADAKAADGFRNGELQRPRSDGAARIFAREYDDSLPQREQGAIMQNKRNFKAFHI